MPAPRKSAYQLIEERNQAHREKTRAERKVKTKEKLGYDPELFGEDDNGKFIDTRTWSQVAFDAEKILASIAAEESKTKKTAKPTKAMDPNNEARPKATPKRISELKKEPKKDSPHTPTTKDVSSPPKSIEQMNKEAEDDFNALAGLAERDDVTVQHYTREGVQQLLNDMEFDTHTLRAIVYIKSDGRRSILVKADDKYWKAKKPAREEAEVKEVMAANAVAAQTEEVQNVPTNEVDLLSDVAAEKKQKKPNLKKPAPGAKEESNSASTNEVESLSDEEAEKKPMSLKQRLAKDLAEKQKKEAAAMTGKRKRNDSDDGSSDESSDEDEFDENDQARPKKRSKKEVLKEQIEATQMQVELLEKEEENKRKSGAITSSPPPKEDEKPAPARNSSQDLEDWSTQEAANDAKKRKRGADDDDDDDGETPPPRKKQPNAKAVPKAKAKAAPATTDMTDAIAEFASGGMTTVIGGEEVHFGASSAIGAAIKDIGEFVKQAPSRATQQLHRMRAASPTPQSRSAAPASQKGKSKKSKAPELTPEQMAEREAMQQAMFKEARERAGSPEPESGSWFKEKPVYE